ncbi:hypothetical protein [Natronosalvus halobius]|uniref:hypothetical protein n=1 Tax=Natronosalvus halobius TaxID=2953746 RepID=UPI00209DFA44|nr:hypothetical protein [Natronosalvus halobius]USZ71904.1 hypothetical protein NGM15_00930 [Natronosalvus halobius]
MADTKRSREKQARNEENRQREREVSEARDRGDEAEPPDDEWDETDEEGQAGDDHDSPRECHRRDCTESATFVVVERYQEETGQGAVEAKAFLCRAHTDEESPANLDGAYDDYLFRVEMLPGARTETDTAETA